MCREGGDGVYGAATAYRNPPARVCCIPAGGGDGDGEREAGAAGAVQHAAVCKRESAGAARRRSLFQFSETAGRHQETLTTPTPLLISYNHKPRMFLASTDRLEENIGVNGKTHTIFIKNSLESLSIKIWPKR